VAAVVAALCMAGMAIRRQCGKCFASLMAAMATNGDGRRRGGMCSCSGWQILVVVVIIPYKNKRHLVKVTKQ
jgi:hypothetical protein